MNSPFKTAVIIIALGVVGFVGGLKMISIGIKFFTSGKILTFPDNGVSK